MSVDQERKELESAVLKQIHDHKNIADSLQYLTANNRSANQHDKLVSVLQSLQSAEYLVLTAIDHQHLTLTPEGEKYAESGSPEGRFVQLLTAGPQTLSTVQSTLGKDIFSIGSSQCMKNKWVTLDKATQTYTLVKSVDDQVQKDLLAIKAGAGPEKFDAKIVAELKKRKLVVASTSKTYSAVAGPKFSLERKVQQTDLTAELLRSGKFEESDFKEYNWQAHGVDVNAGTLHPLMKVRSQFRLILLEMGFEEMPTNNYVESSFWNFDALFQPQQHPARDSHDTFFLTQPAKCRTIPQDYLERVRKMHEVGGHGSIGYRYPWKLEEAEKNILRTHTTAVSTRMLYKLAQQQPFKPAKYFSIDRVFRNETLDATHLAEFHQVEGLIADRGLSLGDLLGTIQAFFNRIGISDVKFKPAYNPYTEPSMEIFGFSKQLNKWIEVGNSGMFRPEMLAPMGMPEDVTVIAWGLSLERPTMIKYGIKNIRDLFGPKVKLDLIRDNGIARFDD